MSDLSKKLERVSAFYDWQASPSGYSPEPSENAGSIDAAIAALEDAMRRVVSNLIPREVFDGDEIAAMLKLQSSYQAVRARMLRYRDASRAFEDFDRNAVIH